MPQFIKCRFGPLDERRYTYLNTGEPVVVGDFVKVPDARSHDGAWKRVEVTDTDVEEPNFVYKAILGKIDGQDVDDRLMAQAAMNPPPNQ